MAEGCGRKKKLLAAQFVQLVHTRYQSFNDMF